jgi:hypothetical protein
MRAIKKCSAYVGNIFPIQTFYHTFTSGKTLNKANSVSQLKFASTVSVSKDRP